MPDSPARELPVVLKRFVAQSAVWMALCLGTEIACRFLLRWGYPYNYPAVPQRVIFGDFRFYLGKFAFFHSRQFFAEGPVLTYPAPSVVAFKLLLLPQPTSGRSAVARFAAVLLLVSWALLLLWYRALRARGLSARAAGSFLAATYLLSFAFWFEFHQANIEFAVWAVVTAGLCLFWRERWRSAAVCFGIAAAMKLFPVIFLGLFVSRRQYREIGWALLTAAFVTVGSLWLVCPDLAYSWQQTSAAVSTLRSLYMLQLPPVESGFDHTLFVLLKRLLPTLPSPAQLGRLLNLYLVVVGAGGCLVFFVRIRKLPVINQILCLSTAAVLFPPVSYDYTLIHLYAPLALLTLVAIEDGVRPRAGLTLAFALLAFTLSAQSEFILHGLRVAGQLKAVALAGLFVVGLRYPFGTVNEQRSPEPTQYKPSFPGAAL